MPIHRQSRCPETSLARLPQSRRRVVVACAAVLSVLASAALQAQQSGNILKCTTDTDCVMIKGACGPGAANKQYVQEAKTGKT
jgi:hypothetical protein